MCGLYATLGSHCYAEMGAMIKTSGADYVYITESWGAVFGYMYLWVALVVIWPCSMSIVGLTFASYLLQPFFPDDCPPPIESFKIIALLALWFLTVVNIWSADWGSRIQFIFTAAKIVALLIIIGTGIVRLVTGHTENFNNVFEGSSEKPGTYALAFYSGIFSYAGWNSLCYVTEEIKEPEKNLPRAIWISLPLVTTIYVLANVAYFTVLTPHELLTSPAVAVTFGQQVLGVMSWVMPASVAISTFGSLNGCVYVASRLYYVGARNGHLPRFLATLHLKFLTPVPALLLLCSIASLYIIIGSDIYDLITYTSWVETLFVGLTTVGLLLLRYSQPDRHRPIRVPVVVPIVFSCLMVVVVVTPLTDGARACLIGLCMALSGVPFYLFSTWKRKPEILKRFSETITAHVQKLFCCAMEGGEHEKAKD